MIQALFLSDMGDGVITSHQRGDEYKCKKSRAVISGKFSDFLNWKDTGNTVKKINISAAISSDTQVNSISALTVPDTEVKMLFLMKHRVVKRLFLQELKNIC